MAVKGIETDMSTTVTASDRIAIIENDLKVIQKEMHALSRELGLLASQAGLPSSTVQTKHKKHARGHVTETFSQQLLALVKRNRQTVGELLAASKVVKKTEPKPVPKNPAPERIAKEPEEIKCTRVGCESIVSKGKPILFLPLPPPSDSLTRSAEWSNCLSRMRSRGRVQPGGIYLLVIVTPFFPHSSAFNKKSRRSYRPWGLAQALSRDSTIIERCKGHIDNSSWEPAGHFTQRVR